jgi:NAD(P)-dependent dehydrogenase (short-subunit alcohol dehydrogenase family)
MSNRLEGRVALVTGASQGIGEAVVRRFVKEGARVVGLARKAEALSRLADELAAFTPFPADIQDHAALQRSVEQTIEREGKIDILVNNAGFQYTIPFMESTLEQWQHTHRVNIEAQYVLCKLIAPYMINQHYGRIINVSSIQGLANESSVTAYAATKGGITAFTRALAVDLAPYNILVNALAPGAVDTPMAVINGVNGYETEEFQEWYVKRRKILLARPGSPDEMAAATLFLADEENSYMTGHTLVVDGGMTITF